MKSVDPWFYFRIAAITARLKQDRRHHRLGAVGLRSDGVLVAAPNGPACTHTPAVHAEARVVRKMDKNGTVFVVRINASGYAMSRPCHDCQRVMQSKRVRAAYYTINENEYGVIEFR